MEISVTMKGKKLTFKIDDETHKLEMSKEVLEEVKRLSKDELVILAGVFNGLARAFLVQMVALQKGVKA